MSFYHGIVVIQQFWLRVITTVGVGRSEWKMQDLNNGPYSFAFLDHFFPGKYRVEVRKINERVKYGRKSAAPLKAKTPLANNEAIRFSNAADQFRVLINGYTGWLAAFEAVGLVVGNSKKMAKRLTEIVRATSMWSFRTAENPINIEVIDHKALGLRDTDIDGASAISRSMACECVNNNTSAGRAWRRRMIKAITDGKLTVFSIRIITPNGLLKGNALVVPDEMMNGYDVRTFSLNIKSELASNGWFWMTLDTTYGVNPTKSDDMSTAIFHQVDGMYDKKTLMETLKSYLAHTFEELKAGKMTEVMTQIADGDNNVLHEDSENKFDPNRGLGSRIQWAVAELSAAGVPITASQTLMFLYVNGLRNQLLSTQKEFDPTTQRERKKYGPGETWKDKSRHWFPVPYAFTTHIMTREALRVFGFKMPEHNDAFVHQETHTFVVTGEYFALHYANHGGFDLDDGIKVHLRRVRFSDGSVELMAILIRDPVDFGEWSMTTVHPSVMEYAYHKYTDEAPLVDYVELTTKVPQFTTLRNQIQIGNLPFMTNPTQIGNQYSLVDEERVRMLSQAFPAGTGGTVTPKMIWYALVKTWISNLPASNEDLIDVLQQGLGTRADVDIIRNWSENMFSELGNRFNWIMDPFWYWTRLPSAYRYENEGPWSAGDESTSEWVKFHKDREKIAEDYLGSMTRWLNSQIVYPEALAAMKWSAEDLAFGETHCANYINSYRSNSKAWNTTFTARLAQADKAKGEEYVDRMILLLAWTALARKQRGMSGNHDQWLFSVDVKSDTLPYEYYARAMMRIQDGTYDWIPAEDRFMDDDLVNQIREEFKAVKSNMSEDLVNNVVQIMKGHVIGLRPRSTRWGVAALNKLRTFRS